MEVKSSDIMFTTKNEKSELNHQHLCGHRHQHKIISKIFLFLNLNLVSEIDNGDTINVMNYNVRKRTSQTTAELHFFCFLKSS